MLLNNYIYYSAHAFATIHDEPAKFNTEHPDEIRYDVLRVGATALRSLTHRFLSFFGSDCEADNPECAHAREIYERCGTVISEASLPRDKAASEDELYRLAFSSLADYLRDEALPLMESVGWYDGKGAQVVKLRRRETEYATAIRAGDVISKPTLHLCPAVTPASARLKADFERKIEPKLGKPGGWEYNWETVERVPLEYPLLDHVLFSPFDVRRSSQLNATDGTLFVEWYRGAHPDELPEKGDK